MPSIGGSIAMRTPPQQGTFFGPGWGGGLIIALVAALVGSSITALYDYKKEQRGRTEHERRIQELKDKYTAAHEATVKTFSNRLGKTIYAGEKVVIGAPAPSDIEVAARTIVATRNDLRSGITTISQFLNSDIDQLDKDVANLKKEPKSKVYQENVKKTIRVLAGKWPGKAEKIDAESRKLLAEMGLERINLNN